MTDQGNFVYPEIVAVRLAVADAAPVSEPVEDPGAIWRGRVLRAWRENAGLSQAQLADLLHVQEQTVSHWELGRRDKRRGTYREMTDELPEHHGLDDRHGPAFIDTIRSAGGVSLPPREAWSHNYPEPGEPGWVWIRRPGGPGPVQAHLRWGAPLRGEYQRHVPDGGVFIQFPTSIDNPPFEVTSATPLWVAFGRGTVPSGVADRVLADSVDAVTLIQEGWPVEALFDAASDTDETELAKSLADIRSYARRFKISWRFIAPHMGLCRSDRAPYPVDATTLEATADVGPTRTDETGMLRSHLTVSPDRARAFREARGLSRAGAAAAATALDPTNPVTSKHIEAIEDGRLPDVTNLVARLDTVYGADGRLGVERTSMAHLPARITKQYSSAFPAYWVGPVWIQATSPSHEDVGLVVLDWYPWRRRQRIRSGVTLTIRRASKAAQPLQVIVPAGWRLATGTGLPPHALDVNHGWHPVSIIAAKELIAQGLRDIRAGLQRHGPPR